MYTGRASHLTGLAFMAAILAAILVLSGCSRGESTGDAAITQEYAALNGSTTESGNEYLDVNLPDDHRFTTATDRDIINLLENGSGIIYFGFPECPWCRNMMPVLDEAAKDSDVDQIHYLNVREIRDTRSLAEDGTVVIDEPGSTSYAEILAELGDFAPEYTGLNDPTQRRIYVPLVVAVRDGKVVGSHMSTVDSQTDPYIALTEEQHDELLGIYQDLMS